MSLNEYDIANIVILSNLIKNLCTRFNYGNSKDADMIYEIDNCARKILKIVEKT
jgi:hypothetical protein